METTKESEQSQESQIEVQTYSSYFDLQARFWNQFMKERIRTI